MKKGIINVFIFAAGAAIGSAVTWKFVKTKYERIANEEIESVKMVYSKKFESSESEEIEPIDEDSLYAAIDEASRYVDEIKKHGYSTDVKNIKERRGGTMANDGPYIISPEEFDAIDDYQAISLTYFNDGVLANMWDSQLDDDEVKEMVGTDFAEHFGEYEEDTVFVRNDELQADYEITRDWRNYVDVVSGDDPHQVDE